MAERPAPLAVSAPQTLRRVVDALEAAGIPWMVVGSFASTRHGAPRSTHDIDLVIDPTHEALDRFVAELDPADTYAGPSPHAALDNRDQFNVIDLTSSWKVDLIIRKDRSFSRSEFERRAKADLLGMTVWVATAEDTVLAKLEWSAMSGGSDRQLADAITVLAAQGDAIDQEYLDRWAPDLGVEGLLAQAREHARPD